MGGMTCRAVRSVARCVVGIVALGAMSWSCGSASTSSGDAPASTASAADPSATTALPATTAVYPATSVMVPITANDALVDAIVPTHLTEPCPTMTPRDDLDVSVSTRLEPMLGQVLAYGTEHPDQFGSYGLFWRSGSDASVFATFTTDIDQHRHALEQLVQFPDQLIVCQVALAADGARALFVDLTSELPSPQVPSVGLGAYGVELTLLPGNEQLADELTQRYGDAVTINICHKDDGCVGHPL